MVLPDIHRKASATLSCSNSSICITLLLCAFELACSRSSEYYLQKGNELFTEGKYSEAVLNYRNSLNKDVRSAEAHFRLGRAELKLGNSVTAYGEFQRAAKLAPNRDEIRIETADLALNLYSTDSNKPVVLYREVNDTADFLLKKDPNSFDGLRLRGDILALDGKLDEALALFRKANTVRALEPGVILPMAQTLFLLKQPAEAETLARSCIQAHKEFGPIYDVLVRHYLQNQQVPEAEALLKAKVTNIPKDPSPVLALASFYSDRQNPSAVEDTLQRLNNTQQFPTGRLLLGDFYSQKRQFDEALRAYREGLQADPKSKAAYHKRISKVFIAQGKRKEAIDQLNQVVQADAEDMDALLARGILRRESRDTKEVDLAMADLNSVLAKNSNDEVARYQLGLVYVAKGDSKSARGHLIESARVHRGYLPPRLALAELAQREGNYDEAIRVSGEILAMDPTNADARLWHAAGLLGNKNYQQARNELNALLREFPDSADINLHMAVLDTAEKRYREAETRLLKLFKPAQTDLRPIEGLLQVYQAEGQVDKGLKLLESELRQAPDSRPLRLLKAATATRAGKLDVAMQEYEWLRSREPNSLAPYVSLGDLYQMKGDLASALASYEKARQLAPNDSKIIAAVAYLQTLSGQDKEAIANLRHQLTLDPEDLTALNNLAFALAEGGVDLDQALTMAEKARRQAPNNPGVADTLGWVYTKKGLNDSAVQIFRELIKKYPDEPSFRYHLGVALLQQGKKEEARTAFTLSLSKNPPKVMAEKIKGLVAKIN